jgi:hypothetical protein
VPLIRTVLARSLLADGDVAGAADRTIAAIAAARALSFDFPLAGCLETAAVVIRAAGVDADIGEILGAAADLRERGHRPSPPTLRDAVREIAGVSGISGRGPLDRARLDLVAGNALDLLHDVTA